MLQQSFLVDIQNTILFSAIFAFQTLSSLDPQVRNVSSAIFKSTDLPPDSVQVERAGCWQDLNNLVYWLILGHWPFCRRSFPPYFPQFFVPRCFFVCQRSKRMKIYIPIKRNKIQVTYTSLPQTDLLIWVTVTSAWFSERCPPIFKLMPI